MVTFVRFRKFFGDAPEGEEGKTFTQAEVDNIIQTRLKKSESELKAARDEAKKQLDLLTTLKGSTTASEATIAELNAQIEDLTKRAFTVEEVKQQELDRAKTEHEAALRAAKVQADYWKAQHTSAIKEQAVNTALAKAGVKPSMYDVAKSHLSGLTTVVEKPGRDGSITLVIESKIPHLKDGKPADLVLSPEQVTEHWRSNGLFSDMFEPRTRSGAGVTGSQLPGDVTPEALALSIIKGQ